MAPLHTLHRASQRLRVLTGDWAGRCTAIIAPLTLVAIFLNISCFTTLGCGDKGKKKRVLTLEVPGDPWQHKKSASLLPEFLQKSLHIHRDAMTRLTVLL